MSYLGTYQPLSDTWVYTCAGCGREFRVSDPFTSLNDLGSCSAEWDQTLRERSRADRPAERAACLKRGTTGASRNRWEVVVAQWGIALHRVRQSLTHQDRAGVTSVCEKSSPLKSIGSLFTFARA